MTGPRNFRVGKTDEEWQKSLDPHAYRVLRKHGTEPAGSHPLNREKREGLYHCAGCGKALYESDAKYESGSGWPSFYKAKDGAVGTSTDRTLGMERTEVHCADCGGHLGHVFPDGPQPTGLRYCMNGAALKFDPKK